MNIFLLLPCILLSIFLILGYIRTWQVTRDKNQKIFLGGKIPNPRPNGFYKGHTKGNTGPWIGKSFVQTQSSGINVFKAGNKHVAKFHFRTFEGYGVQDKNLRVFKIEYNTPGNSFFLRMVLDEIVETHPGKYIGKAHIRFIPHFPFTVGYFWLEKEG